MVLSSVLWSSRASPRFEATNSWPTRSLASMYAASVFFRGRMRITAWMLLPVLRSVTTGTSVKEVLRPPPVSSETAGRRPCCGEASDRDDLDEGSSSLIERVAHHLLVRDPPNSLSTKPELYFLGSGRDFDLGIAGNSSTSSLVRRTSVDGVTHNKLAARAAAIHHPRETLIPTPLPVTTTYILHIHLPGRLSTGAGAR